MTNNPLTNYSAKPGMFVHLPSNGKYYITKPTLTADGDIEVHPLTAIDELYLKNPDGLYNNESLFKVFKNTVPGIADPSEIPTPDLDALFIALRIATYGNEMAVSAKCSKCAHIEEYNIDLVPLLQKAGQMNPTDTVEIDGLTIHLRPYSMLSNSRISEYTLAVASAAKKAHASIVDEDNEDLRKNLSNAIASNTESLINIAATCVVKIVIPEHDDNNQEIVTDPVHINEYVRKLSSPNYNKLREVLVNLSKEVIDRKFKYKCSECEFDNSGEVSFDPSHFFG